MMLRTGTDVEIKPEPRDERIAHLRDRYEAALKICRDLGVDPRPGTAQQIQSYIGGYDTARQTCQDCIAELRRLGITDPLPIPDEREPYPPKPMGQRPFVDVSQWGWPTSLNPGLHRQRRP